MLVEEHELFIRASFLIGEAGRLRGFGSFFTKQRQARTGRNPRTGNKVSVTEKLAPLFKTGKKMRERLNHAPVEQA